MASRFNARLAAYDYSNPGAYFVTICTYKKKPSFGMVINGTMQLNRAGHIVRTWWRILPYRYPKILLDEVIVMPDHVHGILHIRHSKPLGEVGEIHEFPLQKRDSNTTNDESIKNTAHRRIRRRRMLLPLAIGYFKMNTSKAINAFLNSPGNPIWQRSYYEHIIRSEADLYQIRQYILDNPHRWEENVLNDPLEHPQSLFR